MRITESQLRSIVRQLVSEAPLAGFDPPAQQGQSSPHGRFGSGKYSKDTERVRKIFSSEHFHTNLRKLLQNFPLDIWVSPVVGSYSTEARMFDRAGDRLFLVEPQEAIEKGSDQLANAARAWMERTGGQGALIVPVSSKAAAGEELTPWMIFHAIVDGRGDIWTSAESLEDTFAPDFLKMMTPLTRTSDLVMDVIEAIAVCFGQEPRNQGELNYLYPVDVKMSLAKRIEKVFTFGSARSSYAVKAAKRAEKLYYVSDKDYKRTEELAVELGELANEAVVQAMMTTAGFRYDAAALASIRADADPKLWASQKIEEKLDELVAMSPVLKQSLADSLRGKVAVIGVRAGD